MAPNRQVHESKEDKNSGIMSQLVKAGCYSENIEQTIARHGGGRRNASLLYFSAATNFTMCGGTDSGWQQPRSWRQPRGGYSGWRVELEERAIAEESTMLNEEDTVE